MDPTQDFPDALARRGGALVGITFLIAVLAMLSFSALAVSTAAAREQKFAQAEISTRYLSDAGLATAVYDLRHGGNGQIGSADAPIEFASGTYFVERVAAGGDRISLISTGRRNGSVVRTQLVLRGERDSRFLWGAFGEQGLLIDSNATVDSFDSLLGSYLSQATNGTGGHPYANTNGNVGSNGDIVMRQNSRVYGDATPGPGGTATVTGNAILSGSSAPATHYLELTAVTIPEGVSQGPLLAKRNTLTPIASGTHVFDALVMESGSRILVTGPATLVFESFKLRSNAEFLVNATQGPVEIYVRRDFVLSSNAIVSTLDQNPLDLAFFLASDNIIDPDIEVNLDDIDFDSNSKLWGTIYAPRAAIDIDSNFTLFGAIIARRLSLSSDAQVHYDEALAGGRRGTDADFEIVGWQILPDKPATAPAQ